MWLPNAKRVNLGSNVGGGPYDDMRKPKVCWHMTQGSSLAGARGAFAPYPPHIGYDPKNRELEQYVPLDRHSYAFFNGEADDEYIIQIEVVGFSEDAHNMPDWQVQNIVTDLVDPLEELIGVPPVVIWHGFRGAGEGIVLASASSPIRVTLNELREFSGHLGHQHIPGDGHWDPGRFRIGEVLQRSQGDDVSAEEVWTKKILSYYDPATEKLVPGSYTDAAELLKKSALYTEKNWWYAIDNRNMLLQLAGKPQYTAADVAAEIRPGLVSDLMGVLGAIVKQAIEENDNVDLSPEAREAIAGDVVNRMGGLLSNKEA